MMNVTFFLTHPFSCRDEMIAWNKKNIEPNTSVTVDANGQQQVDTKDGEVIIATVGKAVTAITARLTSLSQFDGTESKVRRRPRSLLSSSTALLPSHPFTCLLPFPPYPPPATFFQSPFPLLVSSIAPSFYLCSLLSFSTPTFLHPTHPSLPQVGQLVAAACSPDNLCRMDPAWHPWL